MISYFLLISNSKKSPIITSSEISFNPISSSCLISQASIFLSLQYVFNAFIIFPLPADGSRITPPALI